MAPDGVKADPVSHYRLIKAQGRMEILGWMCRKLSPSLRGICWGCLLVCTQCLLTSVTMGHDPGVGIFGNALSLHVRRAQTRTKWLLPRRHPTASACLPPLQPLQPLLQDSKCLFGLFFMYRKTKSKTDGKVEQKKKKQTDFKYLCF